MGETVITDWLSIQAPVIVVMGAVIYWLQSRYIKTQDKLEKSQEEKSGMAQDMLEFVKIIKEDRDKDKQDKDKEMVSILREIKESIKK